MRTWLIAVLSFIAGAGLMALALNNGVLAYISYHFTLPPQNYTVYPAQINLGDIWPGKSDYSTSTATLVVNTPVTSIILINADYLDTFSNLTAVVKVSNETIVLSRGGSYTMWLGAGSYTVPITVYYLVNPNLTCTSMLCGNTWCYERWVNEEELILITPCPKLYSSVEVLKIIFK